MKSMTGFGRGEYKDNDLDIIVEIKTINHRYKDYFIRIPRQISLLEDNVRKEIGKSISRGRIEVNIKLNNFNICNKSLNLNLDLAKNYLECLKTLKGNLSEIKGDITLSLVSRFPEVISSEDEEIDIKLFWGKLNPAINQALSNVIISREIEGNNLKKDFEKRLTIISTHLDNVIEHAPMVSREYKNRLEEKLREYTNSIEIDESRLLTEIALYSEKVNITEEITRLKSHIERFVDIIEENEPIGRKMDFLIQEMNREINTIGSKANDISISNNVVDIKSEIEKIREQVQNIE